MVCSICKQSGHNRRTCKNSAPPVIPSLSTKPRFVDDEGNPTTCPCCMEEVSRENAIWCKNGHVHCKMCMFENVKTKYNSFLNYKHAIHTGMSCFVCRETKFKGHTGHIKRELLKYIDEQKNSPEMRAAILDRDARNYGSYQSERNWYFPAGEMPYRIGDNYHSDIVRLTTEEFEFIRNARFERRHDEEQEHIDEFIRTNRENYMYPLPVDGGSTVTA